MTWTDERINELTRLWTVGHSASQIGKALGMSKNAVIGKAHRLKLPARPSPIRAERSTPRPPTRSVPRLRPAVPPSSQSELRSTPQTELRSEPRPAIQKAIEAVLEAVPKAPQRQARRRSGGPSCLWPIGDPGDADFHFCGESAVPGKPYCDTHCAKAYIVKSRHGSQAA